jgi:hypothetical protein
VEINPSWGLTVFIAVHVLNAAGLGIDAALLLFHRPTITGLVIRYPWAGMPILLLQGLGFVGLVIHFYGRNCDHMGPPRPVM